jgi:hypothetical protein
MRTTGALLIALVGLGAGCYHDEYGRPVHTSARLVVSVPPPAPVDEVPPREPYPGAVWMSGYWDYRIDLGRHVWIAGHWAAPPREGVVYMPPTWRSDGRGRWYRVSGRWMAGPQRDAYGRHVAYDAWGRPHYF